MTRRLLPILILMLVLTSCMHQSPFRSEYYFQAMGREGDIVITVNDCSLLSGFLPDEIIGRAERISAVVNVDGGIYGGAEGDFGYMMAIKSGEITKVPLAEVAGKLKCVDPEAGIIQEARMTGISFGDR